MNRKLRQVGILAAALLGVGVNGEEYELDLSDMPRSICGFPSLHTGGKFPEWNTRVAQYLLGFALERDIHVDGVFSEETTGQIEAFQEQAGLTVNGYLNIDTWPSLLGLVTPLEVGEASAAESAAILALQDMLVNIYGYADVSLTGEFDAVTQSAVLDFQSSRNLPMSASASVDSETWHLLLTQCNTNPGNSLIGHYWFDAGWPQGNVSVATLECLQDAGFEYAVFECWRNNNGTYYGECAQNVENAWKAGYEAVDVYMFPDRDGNPGTQVQQLVGNLSASGVKYSAIMIDM